jgi:porin
VLFRSCRPGDRFGIGYYYIDVGNPRLTTIFGTRALLRNEYGVEAFYSFALTPWMMLTPDVQVIRPAQKTAVSRTGPATLERKAVSTATVLGLRLRLAF